MLGGKFSVSTFKSKITHWLLFHYWPYRHSCWLFWYIQFIWFIMFWKKLLLMFSEQQIFFCWHLQYSCWTVRLFPQLVKKCTKQQADSNSSFNFNVKREWTIHAPHVPCTVCQKTTLKVFFQSPVKCERRQCWSRDKVWEMAEGESSMRGKGQRNANSGFCLWVSDCSARPFSKSVPRPLWMDANYPAQQCFSTIL